MVTSPREWILAVITTELVVMAFKGTKYIAFFSIGGKAASPPIGPALFDVLRGPMMAALRLVRIRADWGPMAQLSIRAHRAHSWVLLVRPESLHYSRRAVKGLICCCTQISMETSMNKGSYSPGKHGPNLLDMI